MEPEYHSAIETPTWSPYDNNGGTAVAIAGSDFAVIAADTRMSTGYSILSREKSKIMVLNSQVCIASPGFQADVSTLQKRLHARAVIYRQQHKKDMSVVSAAQLLSNTLYYKRFFPYYSFNLLAGIDSEGKGAVFTYDAIGSYERTNFSCQGTGKALIQPVLDNQLKAESPLLVPPVKSEYQGTAEEAIDLVKDCFASAAERDIYTGDAIQIIVITKDGVREERQELKRD